MEEVKKDDRFAHIGNDPRFHKMRRKDRKVQIDKRFHGMFKDDKFKLKYSVDKRGRPVHTTTNENLRKYYDISGSESEVNSSDSEKEKDKTIATKGSGKKEKKTGTAAPEHQQQKTVTEKEEVALPDDEDEDEDEDEESSDSEQSELGGVPDLARGKGGVSSSEEDSDSEDVSDKDEEEVQEHPWDEMDKEAPEAAEVSSRLAVCNMDWDRIQASDIMMLLNSFKPSGSVVKSVTIYPSEFGVERMKNEAQHGPTELVTSSESERKHRDDKPEYQREVLRQYQLNRLKYYYAVVDCDSKDTALHMYEQCDGVTYEGSGTKFDLRFIPEDMTFEQDPKDRVCDVPEVSSYKPAVFCNTALQQTKVNLTWDETDHKRLALTTRKLTKDDLEKLDVEDYLASDSEEESAQHAQRVKPVMGDDSDDPDTDPDADPEENQIQKYRNLLLSVQDQDRGKKKNEDMEMEITWEPGLKETTKDLVKKKTQGVAENTPWQKFLEKKKDKKKEKKVIRKKKYEDDESEESGQAFSDDDLPEGIDMDDPYFKEEMNQAKGKEKMKKKKKGNSKKQNKPGDEEGPEHEKEQAELSLLMLDEEEDSRKHFNLKDIMEEEEEGGGSRKKRRKRKLKEKMAQQKELKKQKQELFTMDVTDTRFEELYQNPLFNIDPTAPEFKKTSAMEALIGEKLQRRQKSTDDDNSSKISQNQSADDATAVSQHVALSGLVKSVKAKTRHLQERQQQLKKKKRKL